MLHKFLLIGASALALASSALAALPAVADDNDYFVLTQPNGKKIIISPISIIAIALPSEGLCKGETSDCDRSGEILCHRTARRCD